MRRLLPFTAITSLLLATVVMGAGAAGAVERFPQPNECSGAVGSPGLLAGTYHGNVVVTGVCEVDGGAAVITGNLILAPGSALNATFALNDVTSGTSSLTVHGNVNVGSGVVMAMGCEPVAFPAQTTRPTPARTTSSVRSWPIRP